MKASFSEKVIYGKRHFYPANETAQLLCSLVPRYGPGATPAKSLTAEQVDIVRQIGIEVESTVQIVRRNRKPKSSI